MRGHCCPTALSASRQCNRHHAARWAHQCQLPPAAGLAAQAQVTTAVRLVAGTLALQATFTLLALLLRPYISVVLNSIEVACGSLDVAYLAITAAAYLHTGGVLLADDERQENAYLMVRLSAWAVTARTAWLHRMHLVRACWLHGLPRG
jgi:hypothetical protein